MKRLTISYLPIGSIFPNEYNPNVHDADSFDGLLTSIRLFGFTQPIVVDKNTMQIIDGEHRWRCANILNMATIPVTLLDLTEEERMIATIIHNEAKGKHTAGARKKIEDHLKTKQIELNKTIKKYL